MYTKISDYYHLIFPAGKETLEFMEKHFEQHGVRLVLDAACGTGEYTWEFARWGLEAVGVDLDAQMIARAQQKAAEEMVDAWFQVADLKQLSTRVGEKFHAVVCIGNSLVHLLTEEDIKQALREFYTTLTGGGILIIQIVNYDRILNYHVTELPTIKRPEHNLTFTRTYDFRPDKLVDFHTRLTVRGSQGMEEYTGTVTLRPVLRKELEQWLLETGFQAIGFYGNFAGVEHTVDSPATVLVAQRS